MKFRVGDRVKDKTFGYGTIVESKKTFDNISFLIKFDKKDNRLHNGNGLSKKKYKNNTCYWRDFTADSELELIERKYTYEDLKKAPVGTRVTFESGIILIKVDKENYKEIKEYGTTRYIELLKGLKDNWQFMNQGRIIKIEEPEYKTVYECKPEILDNTEKRYLSNVIRPFRDKVKNIIKTKSIALKDKEYIIIRIINGNNIPLPYFDKNTMYKGMMTEKKYSLEELGL